MDLELAGKRALVTGASRGIGLAIAQTLAGEGCRVVIAARDRARLDAAAAQVLATHPRADITTHAADLARGEDQERLATACADVDILVNNAGGAIAGSLDKTTEPMWRESWATKVFGYINLSRAIYQRMKERGSGVILNIIGTGGERLNARYIIGTTGNAALMAFTRSAGSQSPDYNVRIVGINPGYTATDRGASQLREISVDKFGTPDRWQEIEARLKLPFGRMATPQEIANVAAFLVSPQASYVSGTIVTVDAGAANRNY